MERVEQQSIQRCVRVHAVWCMLSRKTPAMAIPHGLTNGLRCLDLALVQLILMLLSWQLSNEGSPSGSLGCLKEGERNWAEPTTSKSWIIMTSWIWRPGPAAHPWCPLLGPQS